VKKVPGIFERGGAFWISYFDPSGKRRRERAGKFPAALELLAVRKTQIRKNEYVPPRQSRAWTFSRLAREAISSKALRLTASTVETDQFRLVRLLPIIGHVRFDRLTSQRIEAALAVLKGEGLSPSTLNRYRSFVSSVFSYAEKNERIGSNPCKRVGRFKENESRLRWLREDEEKKLRVNIVEERHEWEFDVALYTGIRRGELFSLKWADCDLDRGLLTVRGKTGRRHVVANPSAVAALWKLREISGEKEFVVPERNGAKGRRDGRRWLEEAVKRARIRDFRFHDIRHTFASRLAMKGVDIRTIQELLGHKSIVMTMRYSHLSSDHRQRAAAKIKAAK
jgi:integrase